MLYVCVNCFVIRGLGLGFTNPVGTGGSMERVCVWVAAVWVVSVGVGVGAGSGRVFILKKCLYSCNLTSPTPISALFINCKKLIGSSA